MRSLAPDAVVWWTGLRWVEAAHMQLDRFVEAVDEQAHALADARLRHQLSDDSKHSRTWREQEDRVYEQFHPHRPIRVPSWALQMQVATELDLFIVAVRNVLRAQSRIPKAQMPEMTGQEVLELLRNIAEHFDEVGGLSSSTLAEKHPGFDPSGLASDGKEIWLGGMDGIPVSRVEAWLWRVWRALVASLSEAGTEVPGDLQASSVDGDDDLPWPAERLRYHWSIPRVEEPDWPRVRMPSEVAELLAAHFSSLRSRDSDD